MIELPRGTSSALWRKSRRSQDTGACVEVADIAGLIGVRDSKNLDRPALMLGRAAFSRLATEVKAKNLDI